MSKRIAPMQTETDEDYIVHASATSKQSEQDAFTTRAKSIKKTLGDLAQRFRDCSILLLIDSPFTRHSFRVVASRHSTGDTTWDKAVQVVLQKLVMDKTHNPDLELTAFRIDHAPPPPVTDSLLKAALDRALVEGDLSPNQHERVMQLVEKIRKEEEQKARNSEFATPLRFPHGLPPFPTARA